MDVLEVLHEDKARELYDWCKSQPLKNETKSSYVSNRVEAWYGLGSNLMSIEGKRAEVFSRPNPPNFVIDIGLRYFPDWNSVLVCGGDTTIAWHRDHGHFTAKAVMINLGDALFEEMKDPRTPQNTEKFVVKFGEVLLLDTKILHRATQMSEKRFNITFRLIRPDFLQFSLF